MNVEVKENNATQVFVVKKLLSFWTTQPSTTEGTPTDSKVVEISVSSGVVVIIIVLVLICLCRLKRRKRRLRSRRPRLGNVKTVSAATTTTSLSSVYVVPTKGTHEVSKKRQAAENLKTIELRTTEDVTRRYQRSVSSLSAKSQIYLVPFDVLPPNFDFASRDVQVQADYVILKDLALLEKYPSQGIVNPAYERQEAYNPSVSNGSYGSQHSLAGEAYQKQSPYNPRFY